MCDVGIHLVVSLQMKSSLGEYAQGQSFIVILLKKAGGGGGHGAPPF